MMTASSPSHEVVTEAITLEPSRPALGRVFDIPLLLLAAAAAAGAGLMTAMVVLHPFMPWDAAVERTVQSIDWGPLALAFPAYSWIGDAKGAALEAAAFALILLFNRRAWILAVAGACTGAWYVLINHLVSRARPVVGQVLRVTEHPGASSFPSGHTIFVATVAVLLMLCLGRRYLPRRAQPAGWALVLVIVAAGALERVYVGAHWPSDVIASLLIATSWLALLMSVRRLSDSALGR
jgi:membrane-associated phospholipid phosphatase